MTDVNPSREDLTDLVAAAKAGDRPAFEKLVRETYAETYTLARRLLGNEEDAKDVVQEAYLRAWKSIGRFRGDAQFSTWMYRITANAAYTLSAKNKRQQTSSMDDFSEIVETRAEAMPEADVESSNAELQAALQQLPEKFRMVIVLKDIYDLPHYEIAEQLGSSEAAAKVRLHRARKALRDILYQDGSQANAV